MKITIKGKEKEIVFSEYTRSIDKWYKEILYKDFSIWITEGVETSKFNPMTLEEANDYLVKNLTNLTEDELLNLSNQDYMKILEECKKLQTPPQNLANS